MNIQDLPGFKNLEGLINRHPMQNHLTQLLADLEAPAANPPEQNRNEEPTIT